MTVYKPIKTMNLVALNFALDLAKGKKTKNKRFSDNGYMKVPTYFIDVFPVTKETIDSTVIKTVFTQKKRFMKNNSRIIVNWV